MMQQRNLREQFRRGNAASHPDCRATATRATLADLGARLDAHRFERLAAHRHLTMTGLYNALERLREREAAVGLELTEAERDVFDAGRIRILADLHDAIDRAVLDAYGWSDLARALVGRVGATLPSSHKSARQEAAEDDLLSRLVDLNHDRATEEARGTIHWLRPEFQSARLAGKYPRASQGELAAVAVPIPVGRLAWPKDPLAQFRALRRVVRAASDAVAPETVARAFKGGRSATVTDRMRTMREMGMLEPGAEAGTFYAPA